MLDSQEETDGVVAGAGGRRCRSLDALPSRDGADILLWIADDNGDYATAGRRVSASCPSLVYDHRNSSSRREGNPPGQVAAAAEHGVGVGEEHAGRNQVRAADRLTVVDGVVAPAGVIAHATGSGSRSPMMILTARPSRSTSPPSSSVPNTAVWDFTGARRQPDDGARKTRQRGLGSTPAMAAGTRATQRLARTKCLQWLNSFDEDD